MSALQYSLHGLGVESDVIIDAQPLAAGGLVNMQVRSVAGAAPSLTSEAELLAERGGTRRFSAFRDAAGYALTLSDLCTFRVDRGLAMAQIHRSADLDDEIASLFITGALLPFVRSLAGSVVLHASAIAVGGSVVAIAGESGSGKSTLAGLACAAGLSMFADDALCIDPGASQWSAHQGSPTLRLREPAWPIVALLRAEFRRSADGRLSVRPASASASGALPLQRILLPRYLERDGRIRRETVAKTIGMVELLRALRIGSWRDPAILERQTRLVAALVRDVPIEYLRVPRFESLDARAAEQLRVALRADQ